jgi:coenzyme Q-binding protein COQ10
MPRHAETRHLPHGADQMYALVADVARYPEFLPWTAAARVRSVTDLGDHQVMLADLVVSFRVFRESFVSKVTLWPDLGQGLRAIDTEYIEGPFKHLQSRWEFRPAASGCDVSFVVDFEFRNRLLQGAAGLFFNEAMHQIVRAFEKRARLRTPGGQPVRLNQAWPGRRRAVQVPLRAGSLAASASSRSSAKATLRARTSARPGAPNSTVQARLPAALASAKQTRPSGLWSDPPGPAMPVMASASCASDRARAPPAISSATGSETAPCAASVAGLTPSIATLAALE